MLAREQNQIYLEVQDITVEMGEDMAFWEDCLAATDTPQLLRYKHLRTRLTTFFLPFSKVNPFNQVTTTETLLEALTEGNPSLQR